MLLLRQTWRRGDPAQPYAEDSTAPSPPPPPGARCLDIDCQSGCRTRLQVGPNFPDNNMLGAALWEREEGATPGSLQKAVICRLAARGSSAGPGEQRCTVGNWFAKLTLRGAGVVLQARGLLRSAPALVTVITTWPGPGYALGSPWQASQAAA